MTVKIPNLGGYKIDPNDIIKGLFTLTIEMSDDTNVLPQWVVGRSRTNVIDPPVADLLGIESDDTSNDEHIACLEKQIANLQGEVERVRNFGKLPASDTPPQEPRTIVPMCPHFPSLESVVPNHFPSQNTQPTRAPFMNLHPINPLLACQAQDIPKYINPSLNPFNQIHFDTQHVTPPPIQVPFNPQSVTLFPGYLEFEAKIGHYLAKRNKTIEKMKKRWHEVPLMH
ncbi:hypothetical protein H5410_015635 [Solanum commersonii]|uniref:Uncharacterized protein n=1 Tax=Solanum commersonii TaxID=4109 RepID=A0A9J5ZUP3_SOLCO|nr:hypothetical protein H5410_015635 [Solanum commersonii]